MSEPAAARRQLIDERNWPPPGGSRRLRGLARLAPLVGEAKAADHIHSHFATEAADIGRLLANLSGTPFSFTAHATDAYGPPEELAVNIRAARFARACSDHVGDRLIAAAGPLSDRIVRLGVAIDFAGFERTTPYRADGPIVSVGRLVEKKGFIDLITAFSRIADRASGRRLVIIGEGPQRVELEGLIASTGAPVDLLGALPNGRVAGALHDASAFALTPRTADDGDRDGRPAAIAEAMAAGLPVLSTSQPGIPDLVSSDCGVLASPGDIASIEQSLSRPSNAITFLVVRFVLMSGLVLGFSWYAFHSMP